LLVAGDAGMGKSRLLTQFLVQARRNARQRNVASAECLEFAEQPFGAFRQLFAQLGSTFPGAEDALVDKREIFTRVVSHLRSLAEQRATVLAIEDLHWADRSTLELLSFLAPRLRGARLLIVASYRSNEVEAREALSTALSRLLREATVSRVELGPFTEVQMRELIDHALGDRWTSPAAIRRTVIQRSEGNPFFAEELLKDVFELGSEPGASLPFSVRQSIGERLASLHADDRRILGYAAVLGQRFDPELLAAAMERSVDDVLPTLRRARDLNVLVDDEPDGSRFRFRHALVRDVVAASMVRFDVKRTHRQILAMLEALPDPARHIDALAHHAWAARDLAKTATYSRLASEAALALRALPEAADFQRRVLDAVEPGSKDEADAIYALALIEDMQGLMGPAAEHFAKAAAGFQVLEDFDAAAYAVRGLVTARNNLADSGAVEIGRSFLHACGSRVSTAPKDMLLALLARLATIIFDHDSVKSFLGAIDDPAALPPRARQNYHISQMNLLWYKGEAARWQDYAHPQIGLLESLPPFTGLTVLYELARAASSLGFVAIADDALARAARIEERWDFAGLLVFGAAVRARHALRYGRLADARSELLRALNGPEVVVARIFLAEVAAHLEIALGEPNLVTPALEEQFTLTRLEEHLTCDDAGLLAAAAARNVARGRLLEARSDLRLALSSLDRAVPSSWEALVLAALHLETADLPRLRALIAGPFAESDRPGRAGAALSAAILERRFGSALRATALANEAAQGFRRLRWPFLEATALEEAGRLEEADALLIRCGFRRVTPDTLDALAGRGLSGREDAVARQVARGATNAQIAELFSISVRTVEKHVTSIFHKLGVQRRSQITALFTLRRLERS